MSKVPKWKAILILAVILLCVYGAIGIPKSKAELVANWNHNIRLGLDLKGGTLLVLEVKLQDAFKAEAATTVERLKETMGKNGIGGQPVSYTHLDVYKRQRRDWDLRRRLLAVARVNGLRVDLQCTPPGIR